MYHSVWYFEILRLLLTQYLSFICVFQILNHIYIDGNIINIQISNYKLRKKSLQGEINGNFFV